MYLINSPRRIIIPSMDILLQEKRLEYEKSI